MNIWLINHYAVPPKYYPLTRAANFAKYLIKKGHSVTIFAASTVHYSDINLVDDNSSYKEIEDNGIPYVLVRCHGYKGNGLSRIFNMFEFAMKLPSVCSGFAKPDAVVATSIPPMSCAAGVYLAKKYHAKAVAEIADLWPESLVAYKLASPFNPAVLFLRKVEKWIYKNADSVVFTMGGAYDYIVERGWEQTIPRSKVSFINNGVDLEVYDYNREHFSLDDSDLDDPKTFKIIYTGSLGLVIREQLLFLMDAIGCLRSAEYKNYRFLIYGKGELLPELEAICKKRGYSNVLFKGYVEKKYIPYILSKCNLNILHCRGSYLLNKYGDSQNKMFEYIASGHPTIAGTDGKYSVIANNRCGISKCFSTPQELADAIVKLEKFPISGDHIRSVAEKYDFKHLTDELLRVLGE